MRTCAKAKERAKAEIAKIAADASQRPRRERRQILPGLPPRRARGPISRLM